MTIQLPEPHGTKAVAILERDGTHKRAADRTHITDDAVQYFYRLTDNERRHLMQHVHPIFGFGTELKYRESGNITSVYLTLI